ncbi:MAG: type II toxin-antitoxin system Phd/YefM family antitoxin [Parvularculaceae bacterium]
MREIALYDARNNLSALIDEVAASGEEILITRHGAPAARLAPVLRIASAADRRALFARLAASRDAFAITHANAAAPVPWDEVKSWMDEGR